MGIICDCGEFLIPTHKRNFTDAKIYSCTCGLKWYGKGYMQKQLTESEYKRMSHIMKKH